MFAAEKITAISSSPHIVATIDYERSWTITKSAPDARSIYYDDVLTGRKYHVLAPLYLLKVYGIESKEDLVHLNAGKWNHGFNQAMITFYKKGIIMNFINATPYPILYAFSRMSSYDLHHTMPAPIIVIYNDNCYKFSNMHDLAVWAQNFLYVIKRI